MTTYSVLDNLDTQFANEAKIRKAQGVAQYTIAGGAVVGASLIAVQPAKADPIADVNTMVTGLGTLAGAALVVALAPMAIAFAFKIIRRVMA